MTGARRVTAATGTRAPPRIGEAARTKIAGTLRPGLRSRAAAVAVAAAARNPGAAPGTRISRGRTRLPLASGTTPGTPRTRALGTVRRPTGTLTRAGRKAPRPTTGGWSRRTTATVAATERPPSTIAAPLGPRAVRLAQAPRRAPLGAERSGAARKLLMTVEMAVRGLRSKTFRRTSIGGTSRVPSRRRLARFFVAKWTTTAMPG
mmetsp:Transcript_15347/g.33718  ORF Transcript_15347/g.33718 Transcript_15347/m.33718 type:complete len:205 (-) Transcript_15347:153-767(-)